MCIRDRFSEVGEGIANFHSSLSQAGDYLDAFDDTMLATAEAQQALADNMQAVQDGITTICRKAAEERRGYTAEEITQLDQYFDQLNELTKQQLDVQLRKLETIQNVSIEEANTFEGTSSEYLAQAKKQINTARQQRDAVIDLAEQQYTTEIALLEQAYNCLLYTSGAQAPQPYDRNYRRQILHRCADKRGKSGSGEI